MSKLKKIREEKNLTQEELAEKSGLSVRTIQRIEAGTAPKGYTLKTLVASLDVSENYFSADEIFVDELPSEQIEDLAVLHSDSPAVFNERLVKIINLSSLPFCWLPIANFVAPLLVMIFTKEKSLLAKQIISLQIFLAIVSPIIFMLVALLKLGKESVMMTMVVLVLANVYIILRNAYELDKNKNLYYRLKFSFL